MKKQVCLLLSGLLLAGCADGAVAPCRYGRQFHQPDLPGMADAH